LPKSYFNVFGKQEKTQNDLGNYAIMHYNDENLNKIIMLVTL